MKILKNISRYFFMALLLAGCILLSIYCGNAAAQLQAQIESPAFITMAIHSPADAILLLDRQEYFEALMQYGIIAAIVVVLLTFAMIVMPILVKKWKKSPKKEKPAVTQPAPLPSVSAPLAVPQVASPMPPVIPHALQVSQPVPPSVPPAEPSDPSIAPQEPQTAPQESQTAPQDQDTVQTPQPAPHVQPS